MSLKVVLKSRIYIGGKVVHAHAQLRARADVVAPKLGIILFSFFLPSFLPLAFLPGGVCLRF